VQSGGAQPPLPPSLEPGDLATVIKWKSQATCCVRLMRRLRRPIAATLARTGQVRGPDNLDGSAGSNGLSFSLNCSFPTPARHSLPATTSRV